MSFLVSGVAGVLLSVGLWLTLPSSRSLSPKTSPPSPPLSFSYGWAVAPRFVCLNITNILAYFVSKSLSDWSALYLMECLQFSAGSASMLTMTAELGAAAGTVGSGILSDALGGAVEAAGLTLSLLWLPAASLLYFSDALSCFSGAVSSSMLTLMMTFLFIFGASASGPKNLVGLSVRDVVPESALGTANGVVGLTSQIGSAMAGLFAARMLEMFGWRCFLPMLFGGSILLTICLVIGWKLSRNADSADEVKKKKE